MNPELQAAFDAAVKADQEFKAAREKLNAAIKDFVNVAVATAQKPAGFAG